jgi:hypothetical protein
MSLATWKSLHKEYPMTKQVKVLLNIGTVDAKRLAIQPYSQDEVVTLNAEVADKLIRMGAASEYDAAAKHKDDEDRKAAHDAAVKAAIPEAERELAAEAAKEEAAKIVKAGPVKSHGTSVATEIKK